MNVVNQLLPSMVKPCLSEYTVKAKLNPRLTIIVPNIFIIQKQLGSQLLAVTYPVTFVPTRNFRPVY